MTEPFEYLRSLELAARTERLLREHGIDTIDRFLELRDPDLRGWRGAGVKTWRDIRDAQERLNPRPSTTFARLHHAVNVVNTVLSENPNLAMRIIRGKLCIYQAVIGGIEE